MANPSPKSFSPGMKFTEKYIDDNCGSKTDAIELADAILGEGHVKSGDTIEMIKIRIIAKLSRELRFVANMLPGEDVAMISHTDNDSAVSNLEVRLELARVSEALVKQTEAVANLTALVNRMMEESQISNSNLPEIVKTVVQDELADSKVVKEIKAELANVQGQLVALREGRAGKEGSGLDIPVTQAVEEHMQEVRERERKQMNLVVFGVKEEEGEDLSKVSAKILATVGLEGIQVQAVRVGRGGRGSYSNATRNTQARTGAARERPIVFTCKNMPEKTKILKAKTKLRGTDMSHVRIDLDLTPRQQQWVRDQWPKVEAARAEGKYATIRDGHLIIEDKRQVKGTKK